MNIRKLWCRLLLAIITVIASSSPSSVKAQEALPPQTDSLAQFVRNIVTYNNMIMQEKVYLHFDNTGYFMGETIWFKAYVVNPMSNRPNILSRVLYVELLTPEGRVMQTHKLKIENGQCHGQLSLEELLHPGFYEVRAYTALMLNWPEAPIFSRVFPIFNAPQREGKGMYKNPIMVKTSQTERLPKYRSEIEKLEKVNIQFFPEGGNMITGIPSKIMFKATDKRNNPLEISGRIIDSKQQVITTTQVQHDGMGSFALTPQTGEQYYMEIAQNGKKPQLFELPKAMPEGFRMSIDNMQDNHTIVHIARSTKADTTRALGTTIMCRGQVLAFKQIYWKGQDTIQLHFDKSQFSTGVNQVTLFDTEGKIHAERLIFIPAKQKINFSLTGEKEKYSPQEKVEMNFKLTDTENNPVRTIFSLAVRDADTDTPTNYANGGNISANLLLGSELKGYIHNISYYFESDDIQHRQALDLLLCTQGWKRYNWEEMTNPQEFDVKYPAEEGIMVVGNLTSTFRNRIKDGAKIKVSMYNGAGQTRVGSCLTDSVGQFAFLAEDFNGRWIMHIQTYEKDKAKEMNVNLKKTPSPQGRLYADEEEELFFAQNAGQKEKFNVDTLNVEEDIKKQRWENLLPTVEIESSKEWQTESIRKWHNLIYDMEDERMRMDETGEQYLVEFYRWLEDTNPFFTFDVDTSSLVAHYKGRPVQFFVRRTGTGDWLTERNVSIDVASLTINDVEAIAISDKPNAKSFISRTLDESTSAGGDTVIVSIFVRNDYFRHKEYRGQRQTKIQGFTPGMYFYMPDYSYTDLPDEKDFRRTLYWAPYVVTNEQGEATVSFYNSPLCEHIRISAETITYGGIMGSFEK